MIPRVSRVLIALLFATAVAVAQQQRAPIVEQLAFTPYHASGIYDVGETVGWTVTPGAGAADLRLQVDDSPQQRGGAQGRQARSRQPARRRSKSSAISRR